MLTYNKTLKNKPQKFPNSIIDEIGRNIVTYQTAKKQ